MRIVAATHHDLRSLITQGLFREDLYFRLSVVPIRLPPLRERTSDIPELARHFMARATSEGLPSKILDGRAMERLKATAGRVTYVNWRTSSDALQHFEETIGVEVIEAELADASPAMPEPEADGLGNFVERQLRTYFNAHGDALPAPGLFDRVLREIERPLIMLTLEATRGNQIRAAEVLGLNRNTLRKKIRDLNIPVVRGGGR